MNFPIRLEVPRKVPSHNVLRRKYRNPHAYARLRDSWQKDLFGLIGPKVVVEICKWHMKEGPFKMRVKFIGRKKGIPYDDDNFIAGCKPVRDCLERLKVIHKDSSEWLEASYEQEKAGSAREITIIELEPDTANFSTPGPTGKKVKVYSHAKR